MRSFRARRIRREHGRKRGFSHGVRGLVEAPYARRLRGTLRTRRLQLRSAAGSAELCAMPQPPAQGGAEGPQAILQIPALHLREMPPHGRPAASDGATDCTASCPGARRCARAGSRVRAAAPGRGAGAPRAAHREGAAQPYSAAAAHALAGFGQLRLGAGQPGGLSLRAAATVRAPAAGHATAAAAATARLVDSLAFKLVKFKRKFLSLFEDACAHLRFVKIYLRSVTSQ